MVRRDTPWYLLAWYALLACCAAVIIAATLTLAADGKIAEVIASRAMLTATAAPSPAPALPPASSARRQARVHPDCAYAPATQPSLAPSRRRTAIRKRPGEHGNPVPRRLAGAGSLRRRDTSCAGRTGHRHAPRRARSPHRDGHRDGHRARAEPGSGRVPVCSLPRRPRRHRGRRSRSLCRTRRLPVTARHPIQEDPREAKSCRRHPARRPVRRRAHCRARRRRGYCPRDGQRGSVRRQPGRERGAELGGASRARASLHLRRHRAVRVRLLRHGHAAFRAEGVILPQTTYAMLGSPACTGSRWQEHRGERCCSSGRGTSSSTTKWHHTSFGAQHSGTRWAGIAGAAIRTRQPPI